MNQVGNLEWLLGCLRRYSGEHLLAERFDFAFIVGIDIDVFFLEIAGLFMYCKMLNEAVKKLKGETVTEQVFETAVEIKVDAFIPNSYIKNELQKLDIYKRIAEIENEEEKFNMIDELIDRFGEPPKSVENLLAIALLKEKAHRAYITEITSKKESSAV